MDQSRPRPTYNGWHADRRRTTRNSAALHWCVPLAPVLVAAVLVGLALVGVRFPGVSVRSIVAADLAFFPLMLGSVALWVWRGHGPAWGVQIGDRGVLAVRKPLRLTFLKWTEVAEVRLLGSAVQLRGHNGAELEIGHEYEYYYKLVDRVSSYAARAGARITVLGPEGARSCGSFVARQMEAEEAGDTIQP